MSARKSSRLKQTQQTPTSPKTPLHPRVYSPRLKNSVKRNLNSSFGAVGDECVSPRKQMKSNLSEESEKLTLATLVIDKRSRTCRNKYYYYESCSDSDDNDSEKEIILTGKRKIKTPLKLKEVDEIYQTPTKTLKVCIDEKDVTPVKNKLLEKEFLSGVRTPKTPQRYIVKTTPRNTLKLIRTGAITPKVQSRGKAIKSNSTPLKQARSQLHVSWVPTKLPCREKEYEDIYNFLERKLLDKCGGCMYISGVPGTGKTATVTGVINHLMAASETNDVPEFQYVNINGMKLTEPRQAYVEIVKQSSGKTVPWEQAQSILEEKFTKKSKKMKLPIILVVDELDIICTKRQDVVYNILDWPSKPNSQLIVITIANTMDLPERLLMNRVTSRLGLTRLTFQAYTHKQLQEIVTKRLLGTNSFNCDAVQLVARKVASVSGDARRALDICRRAAEIAESSGDYTLVTMAHVNEALKAMMTQPKLRAIKHCSRLEKYILQAVIAEMERTGVEETVFPGVFNMLLSICRINGFQTVSCTVALRAISKLGACRLLLVDPTCHDLDQKIILNVSADDVYYALNKF